LIATILQKQASVRRTKVYESVLEALVESLLHSEKPSEDWFVETAGVKGKVLTGSARVESAAFSEEAKSQAFITTALAGILRCPQCDGYLDAEKSMSYDHNLRVREGGTGDADNILLMHPYCNQAMKN
jgi:hypothetical protein